MSTCLENKIGWVKIGINLVFDWQHGLEGSNGLFLCWISMALPCVSEWVSMGLLLLSYVYSASQNTILLEKVPEGFEVQAGFKRCKLLLSGVGSQAFACLLCLQTFNSEINTTVYCNHTHLKAFYNESPLHLVIEFCKGICKCTKVEINFQQK